MKRQEVLDQISAILKRPAKSWDAIVRSRSTPSCRFGVGCESLIIRGRIRRYYMAYGASWEQAIEKLRQKEAA